MKKLLPLILIVCAGCKTLTGGSVPSTWVAADRARHDAVAPEYIQYVDNDANLSNDDKLRRHRTVKAWDLDLAEHEKAVQGK